MALEVPPGFFFQRTTGRQRRQRKGHAIKRSEWYSSHVSLPRMSDDGPDAGRASGAAAGMIPQPDAGLWGPAGLG